MRARSSRAGAGLVALIAAWTGARVAHAVDPVVPLSQLALRHWGENDGLPQPRVRALAQDRDGYLWLGTDGGVVRFDGARFDAFTPETTKGLGTRAIRTLLVDGRSRLWIGTHGEGALSVRQGREVRSLRGTADARGSAIISMLAARDGSVWFGGWGGAMHLVGDRWSSVGPEHGLPSAPLFGFAEEQDGTLWLGTWTGLYRMRGDRAERVPLAGVRPDLPIRALARAPDGTLWVGTIDEGLLAVKVGEAGFVDVTRFAETDGLPHHVIEALLVDRAGVLWIGTRGGLARRMADRFEAAPPGSAFLRTPIESLLEDGEGRLWVGSATEGLIALSSGPITALTEADGLPRQAITAAAMEPDGTVWIGTRGDGVLRVAGPSITRFRTAEGLCTMNVAALLIEAPGIVWVGGTGGERGNVCRLDRRGFATFGAAEGFGGEHHNVRGLLLDGDGSVLVGGSGLYRFTQGRFDRVPLPDEGADRPHGVFSLGAAPEGALLVGTGVGLFRGRPGAFERLGGWFVASAVQRPDGELWLGTIQGLVRRAKDGTWKRGTAFGVPDQPVHGVVDDGLGHVWIASPTGLARVSVQRPPSVRRFDLADGLPTTQLTEAEGSTAAVRAPDGKLLFATAKGLAIVDPARVAASPPAPAALIDRLRARHLDRPLAAVLRLEPGDGDLELHYTAPAPGRAERLTFQYRLQPIDSRWVDAGARRLAVYTSLPHGRYTFEVRAVNEEGVPGPASRALAIEVAPFWYERWSVRLAGLAALAALAFALHRMRLARAEARHRAITAERTRIAREIHDSLTQELTGISLHLEAAHRRIDDAPAKARANLDQARALVRVGLAEARAVVWELQPAALRRLGLTAALAELVRQMSADVPVRLQIDGDGGPVPPDAQAALLRVAQEAVANALRHARPTQVSVTLTLGSAAFDLHVRDDGVGFDPAATPDDRGLGGMRRRLADVGGTVTLASAPGTGTEVHARIPRSLRGDAAA